MIYSLQAAGIDAIRIVPEGADIPLSERVARANKYYAESGKQAILVSIHCNAAGDGSAWMTAREWSVFVDTTASASSKRLATAMRRMPHGDDRRINNMNELKTILNNEAFLGRGWSFPPQITDGGVRMSAYEQDIEESLRVLFSTSPGERVNRYDYGCPLRRYAFKPITTETTVRMRNDITRAIILYEPRITLEEVSFEEQPEQGVLLIHLAYTVIRTNNRNNMVYPFYLNEGTNLKKQRYMNRLRLIKTAYTALAALMLAACASDELTDGTVQDLPEGKYPLQISSVTMTAESTAQPWDANAPQTRVSENTDGTSSHWDWNGTEQIGVKFYDDVVTYTLNSNNTLTADKTLYWKNKNPLDVTAWYPATNGTLDLSDQSKGLKYAMTGSGTGTYNNPITLNFSHQLAKVRVKLTGTNVSAATSVSVKGNTKCIVTQGEVSSSGAEGYISMRKPVTGGEYWEANVVPGTINKTAFLQVNGIAVDVETTVTKLDAAKYYNFEVKVEKKRATPNGDGSYTIKAGDNVYIAGTVTGTITISGTANVELRNVTSNTDTPIKIISGTPVIKVTGTNTLTTKNGTPGIHLDENDANVEITGDGTDKSSLTITVPNSTTLNQGSPAIGSCGEYNQCGNIKISNITLTASGNKNRGGDYSAAIGTGAGFSAKCGNIIIENSIIIASAQNNAAAIGFGKVYDGGTISSITITNSQLNLTVTGEGAGIGFGSNNDNTSQSIGPISVTSNESESTFFARFNVQGYKVGKSSNNNSNSNQSWQGVTFNGNTLVSGSSDGY